MTMLDRLSDLVGDHPFMKKAESAERYVISDRLVQIMGRDDVAKSIQALVEAGLCVLPFENMLVEFSVEPGLVNFVHMQQAIDVIEVTGAFSSNKGMARIMDEKAIASVTDGSIRLSGATDPKDSGAIIFALSCAFLLTNTRGVEIERVDNAKLNRAREKRGQAPKPDYSYVRIGYIYERQPGQGGRVGVKQPVHFRSGYVRQVAYGPNKSLTRMDYVPPCIVNFAGQVPQPKERKVVARGVDHG